jgi:PqqD family protein of HPr-rel-A system
MKWQLHPAQSLRLRCWDDEAIVYNDCSGDTHLVSASAADVLTRLAQCPADEASLAAQCAAAWGMADDAELRAQLHELLSALKRLSLVEPIPEQ